MNDEQRAQTVKETFTALAMLSNENLQKDVIACWVSVWKKSSWERLNDCPMNPSFPEISLVDHINCVTDMALAASKALEKYAPGLIIDRDHLLTGVLLHDLSKMLEIEPSEEGPVFSDLNRRIPHSVYGAFEAMAQGFDTRTANIILSHTRLSGARPDSPEAVLLHYLDYGMADVLRSKRGLPLMVEVGPKFGPK